jgi:hypothetical protein
MVTGIRVILAHERNTKERLKVQQLFGRDHLAAQYAIY